MRNNEEFRIDQAKELQGKIKYIRVSGKVINGMKYSDVIHGLVKVAVSSGNCEKLEVSRIIYRYKKNFANTYEYKGWYYTIPKRKVDQVDKIIKILKITGISLDEIHVKFIDSVEELNVRKQELEAERIRRKTEAERSKIYAAIINDEVIISDEELKNMIFNDCCLPDRFDVRQYEYRMNNLDMEREQMKKWNIDRRQKHIDWLLNDEKQAELFNCSVEEYRAKFRNDNINEIVM